jgi:hypothetical protein
MDTLCLSPEIFQFIAIILSGWLALVVVAYLSL